MNLTLPYVSSLVCSALIALCLAPAHLPAISIAADSFAVAEGGDDYNIGNLYGQSPSVGCSGFGGDVAWGNANSSSTSDLQVEDGGLVSPLLNSTALTGQLTTAGAAGDRSMYRAFSTVPASDSYFAGFLLKSENAISTIAAFGMTPEYARETLPTATQGILVGVTSDDITLWVDGAVTTVYEGYTLGETYLALISIANNTGGDDTINVMIVDGDADTTNAPVATLEGVTGEISGDLTHLSFLKDFHMSPGMKVDEFRFGTAFTDVVIPEPGLLLIAGPALLALLRRSV